MVDALNGFAMVVGYGAIIYVILWLLGERRKEKWQEVQRLIDRDNAERSAHFKKADPQAWEDAERMREGRRRRNEMRRDEIARLQHEMEIEL